MGQMDDNLLFRWFVGLGIDDTAGPLRAALDRETMVTAPEFETSRICPGQISL